jgi:uncharacterized phage protein (TIGR01671 family)
MREIKFRGYFKRANKWVYGFLNIDLYKTIYSIITPIPSDIQKETAVVKESMGQYTGLKDKNGKEIYEGDIVRWTKRQYFDCSRAEIENEQIIIGTIFWYETMWGIKTTDDNGFLLMPYYIETDEFKVIGNIYENPELLKGGETACK